MVICHRSHRKPIQAVREVTFHKNKKARDWATGLSGENTFWMERTESVQEGPCLEYYRNSKEGNVNDYGKKREIDEIRELKTKDRSCCQTLQTGRHFSWAEKWHDLTHVRLLFWVLCPEETMGNPRGNRETSYRALANNQEWWWLEHGR